MKYSICKKNPNFPLNHCLFHIYFGIRYLDNLTLGTHYHHYILLINIVHDIFPNILINISGNRDKNIPVSML